MAGSASHVSSLASSLASSAARLFLLATAACVVVATAQGCSLLTSLDGLSGGASDATDGGPIGNATDAAADGPRSDGPTSADGAPLDAATRVGSVYVFGGSTDVAEVATVLVAEIRADGMLGTWQTAAPLPEARSYVEAVGGPGLVAVVGGSAPGGPSTSTLIAKTSGAGLGDWSSLGQFAIPRIRHGVALVNDHLYVIGGTDTGNAPLTDVQVASISPTSVGPWVKTSALPLPRSRVAVAATSKFIYVFGGSDGTNSPVSDVNRAPINMDGTLGAFESQKALPSPRTHAQANLVSPSHILVTGGEKVADNAVVYDIDGTVGSLGAPHTTLALPRPTDHHAAVYFGNRVYVIGGLTNDGPRLADVVVGDVASDGTITRWTPTTSLPVPLAFHSAVAF